MSTKGGKKDLKMRQEVHNIWHQSPLDEARKHLKMIAKAGERSHVLNIKEIDNSEGKNPRHIILRT